MSVKNYVVLKCERAEIRAFIEANHYSHSINGCMSEFCFALYRDEKMIGAMFYGRPAMANQYKRFSDKAEDVIELRRLCCVDDTLKNTESYFIGKSLRWLRKNSSYRLVISYADAEHGHAGVIYKAANFSYSHFSKGSRVIDYDDKTYHDKTIRTKYKGELKPFALRIKNALASGLATYRSTKGKHCYVYSLY